VFDHKSGEWYFPGARRWSNICPASLDKLFFVADLAVVFVDNDDEFARTEAHLFGLPQ
jgi:hypothetical protein